MARKIIIPQAIDDKLQELTNLREESNGVLLYRRRGDLCPVEALRMTAVGDPGHVQADPEQIEIMNRFFQQHPEYQFVKFHTHSKGTLAEYGQQYATQFSAGDVESYKDQFRHDPEFIGMLATPETRLLCGMDNPVLETVAHSEDYERNHDRVEAELHRIADELGRGHERFRGMRMR